MFNVRIFAGGKHEISSFLIFLYSTTPTYSVGSSSSAEDSSKLYRYDNCSYIDHRLKLHLLMHVFSADTEEFISILKVYSS